jgi:hypothetical protein
VSWLRFEPVIFQIPVRKQWWGMVINNNVDSSHFCTGNFYAPFPHRAEQSRAEQSRAEAYCRQSAGTVTALASGPSGTRGHIFITCMTITFFLFLVGRPLWWEDGSDFYICCWPLPAQSFFGRLLRLAGSRWRYSIPPPHGGLTDFHTLTILVHIYLIIAQGGMYGR